MPPATTWMFLLSALVFQCTGSARTHPTPADRMVHFRQQELANHLIAADDQERKCQVLQTLYGYWRSNFQDSPEFAALTSRLRLMMQQCGSSSFRVAEFFNQTFIFPGTKWCGQANVAENFHDLGAFNETDACCREHDFCDDIIRAGRTKHNLVNPYGTTRLHCKCDTTLRRCFQRVNSVISNTVGYIFFSVLQTQCFDFDFPAVGCELWRRGAVRLYCVKYKLLQDQPKKWQWFDQEPYV